MRESFNVARCSSARLASDAASLSRAQKTPKKERPMPDIASADQRNLSLLLFSSLLLVSLASTAYAAREGHFDKQQVKAGGRIYSHTCAPCHGSFLQGQFGPALAGKDFGDTIKFLNQNTAAKLFDFIKTNMPKTAPGSLSKKKYLDVFAYILSNNGFHVGREPLTTHALNKIKLLPLPKQPTY